MCPANWWWLGDTDRGAKTARSQKTVSSGENVNFKLLTIRNPKTTKGIARQYLTGILHLAPFNLSGVNVCPMAEIAGCYKACLNTSGHGGIGKGGMVTYSSVKNRKRTNHVQAARIRRTRLFLEDRNEFMALLAEDIRKLQHQAIRQKVTPCVRLNGTSDIRWEDISLFTEGLPDQKTFRGSRCNANIFAVFPDIQFYDYTKLPNRRRALDIPNYRLTFSYSDRKEFQPIVKKAIDTYGDKVNLAVVFHPYPSTDTFAGKPIVNGEENDLRFLDPPGCVVALKAKGQAKKDNSGFVVMNY